LTAIEIIHIASATWVGLSIGSFLNVVVYRLPIMRARRMHPQPIDSPAFNLSVPRSRCPLCGHQICWYENIPVLSYLALGGKCSSCKTHISLRYPLVEATTGLLFAGSVGQWGISVCGAASCVGGAMLLALGLMLWDCRKQDHT
jgi:leader peptidase (prepilin peptidase) / N-methyltransferase